jgi:hypothetical protein
MKLGENPIIVGVGTIAGIIVLIFAFNSYVDSRIVSQLNNADTISKISSKLRPYMIFDENETIINDNGAMQHIEQLSIKRDEKTKEVLEITITPKSFFKSEPIMERLDHSVGFVVKRGKRFEVIYEVNAPDYLIAQDARQPGKSLFRLEIIP